MAKTEILYIEFKGDGFIGPGRIGRVSLSGSGKTIYYRGNKFRSLSGSGFKANFFDVETGEQYWISGCRKDGNDSLYPAVIDIDLDVEEEYWTRIRGLPERIGQTRFRSEGKYTRGGRKPK
jgi:hypothetical protein